MIIYICAKYQSFIKPFAKRFKNDGHDVILVEEFNGAGAKESDVIFCEWGDNNAVNVSMYNQNIPKILRIHRYEAYTNYIYYIKWNAFKDVIFVADHIRRHTENRVGKIGKYKIIRNGIDLSKFEEKHNINKKIGWISLISNKKGFNFLLFLANCFPDYEFHFGGEFQMYELECLYNEKKPPNLYYHGWVKPEEFFSDMSYVLSTSPVEGTQISLLEGMACGCTPIIYDWVGAREIYPNEYIYKNLEEFKKILRIRKSERKFVEQYFNLEDKYQEIKKLIVNGI